MSEQDYIEQQLAILLAVPSREDASKAEGALVALGDVAIGPLPDVLMDTSLDEGYRSRVAGALGRIGGRSCADILITAAKDPSPLVRWNCAQALELMKCKRALPVLRVLLEDKGVFALDERIALSVSAAAVLILTASCTFLDEFSPASAPSLANHNRLVAV